MKIIPVTTQAELRKFIRLPYRLYQNDPVWVPPMMTEILKQYDRKRNPTIDHCDYEIFCLKMGVRLSDALQHLSIQLHCTYGMSL